MSAESSEVKALGTAQAREIADKAREQIRTELFSALVATFEGTVKELPPAADDVPQVEVAAPKLHAVCAWLKDQGFNMLLDIGGVDYLPRDPRFEVVYHLLALPSLRRIRLRVMLPDEEHLKVASVSDLWQSANPAEREVWDQFGVVFAGHPNLTRILNPDDWEGHPLRRDYPLRGPRELNSQDAPADRNRFHPVHFDED